MLDFGPKLSKLLLNVSVKESSFQPNDLTLADLCALERSVVVRRCILSLSVRRRLSVCDTRIL